MMHTQQQQQEARDRLNQLAALLNPNRRQLHTLPRTDLVLVQALEAARKFVPAELESVIDTILDGYTVQTARRSLERLYAQASHANHRDAFLCCF
jgi:hypothetical protein